MKKIILGFVLVLLTLFTNVVAQDNPRAVIIFDASGSMWGQINGVSKIEIAKDALKNVVKEWNPSVELGLTVYGHRSKGDCNDIETLIPVSRINKNNVIKTVMAIKPKGKTPIARSLRKVAEEIKYTEEKATIILISDGKETCDADPCGTAKELEKQGIDFVIHVIGFNVDKKTDKQLECIAFATGGEYFSAKNATALNKAMKSIVKKVEVVKPKPKPIIKKLKKNLEITASEKEGGRWIESYHTVYKIIQGEEDSDRITGCYSKKKESCLAQIPVGKYVMHSTYNDFKKDTYFEVKAGEMTKVHVVFEKFVIKSICTDMSTKVSYEVYASSGRMVYDTVAPCSKAIQLTLDAGTYTIEATIGSYKKEEKFTLGATKHTLVLDLSNQNHEEEIKADTATESEPLKL